MAGPTIVEVQKTRDGWKLKAVLGTVGIVAIVVLAFAFRIEAGLIALGLGGVTVARLWWVAWDSHKARKWDLLEREAKVGIVQQEFLQQQIVTQRLRKSALIHETRIGVFIFKSLEDDNSLTYYPLTATERQASGLIGTGDDKAEELKRPDLLRVFTQDQGSYAILGPQRVGKTWQAMHIADEWLLRGITPVVAGVKREPGEWEGCKQIFTDDIGELETILRQIVLLARKRHAGEMAKNPLPVFIDDWLWVVREVPYAEQFVGEAGTVMASAKIVVYLILQSDTRDAFGVGRYGAMLKDNFTRLYLKPIRSDDGVIIPGVASGYLIYPNEKDHQAVDLIRGTPRCVKSPLSLGPVELPEVEPEQAKDSGLDEAKIAEFVRLVESGQSRRSACQEVFGRAYAGNLVDPLKAALEKSV